MKSSGSSMVPFSLCFLISCLTKERTKSQQDSSFCRGPGKHAKDHWKISYICGASIQHKYCKLHDMTKAITEIQCRHFKYWITEWISLGKVLQQREMSWWEHKQSLKTQIKDDAISTLYSFLSLLHNLTSICPVNSPTEESSFTSKSILYVLTVINLMLINIIYNYINWHRGIQTMRNHNLLLQ